MKRQVTGLLLSMSVHAALFCFAAAFIKNSEYGVQAGSPQIEVDLVAAPEPAVQALPSPEPPKPEEMPAPEQPPAPQPPPIPVRHEESTSSKGKDQVTMQSHVGGAIAAKPDYLHNPAPVYPEIARQHRQEGLVLLEVAVTAEGKPSEISIKKSSGYRLLDQAALNAVRRWSFRPAEMASIPISSKVEVPIEFRLQ